MMARVPYVTRSGELRVYEYAPPERDDAEQRCRRVLRRQGALHLHGKARWRSGGPQSQQFQNSTVQRLIARGQAVRDGDVVRARS
jgi:hypothetical protein